MTRGFLALAACVLGGCASMPGADHTEVYRAAIASPIRTDQDRSTDAARRPAEFLPFIQARPGMRALDVAAAGGTTSQLLALVAGPSGVVYAQNTQPRPMFDVRLKEHPQANLIPVQRPFEDPVPEQAPGLKVSGLDLITIIHNYHDICYLPVDRAKMNARLYAALKPGGSLVVIDHAARSGTGVADTKTLHRVDEAVVRADFLKAGFRLAAEGNYLRNPADPRDMVAYGSKFLTDKFALRFVKP